MAEYNDSESYNDMDDTTNGVLNCSSSSGNDDFVNYRPSQSGCAQNNNCDDGSEGVCKIPKKKQPSQCDGTSNCPDDECIKCKPVEPPCAPPMPFVGAFGNFFENFKCYLYAMLCSCKDTCEGIWMRLALAIVLGLLGFIWMIYVNVRAFDYIQNGLNTVDQVTSYWFFTLLTVIGIGLTVIFAISLVYLHQYMAYILTLAYGIMFGVLPFIYWYCGTHYFTVAYVILFSILAIIVTVMCLAPYFFDPVTRSIVIVSTIILLVIAFGLFTQTQHYPLVDRISMIILKVPLQSVQPVQPVQVVQPFQTVASDMSLEYYQ